VRWTPKTEGEPMYNEKMGKTWSNILDFNNKYFPNWRSVDEVYYSNALAGEVGELCNAVKHRAGGGTNKSRPSAHELAEECADIFIYMSMLLEKQGIDIMLFDDIINEKVEKNARRMESHNNGGK